MSSPLMLLLTWLVGALLGGLFFGGLWWTVRKIPTARHPALWVLGSLVVRTGVTLTGFYLVAGPHWDRMLSCFVGFAVARPLAKRLASPTGRVTPAGKEAGHAS